MYLPKDAPRNRIREAQKARDNRAEVVKARSHGQITRRDLFRWGLFTTSGMLLYKNGFSPYAPSAYAQVPTGTPRSPLFGAKKFSQPMPRLDLQKPTHSDARHRRPATPNFPRAWANSAARGLSYHTDFTANPANPLYRNPLTESRPLRGQAARRGVRPSALGRIPSQGRIRDVDRLGRHQHRAPPSQFPLPGRRTASGATAPGSSPRGVCRRRSSRRATASRSLTRIYNNMPIAADRQWRIRPQRNPAAFPQRAQRRRERRRSQRAPLPRHVLRLPLEHHACPRATRSTLAPPTIGPRVPTVMAAL